MIQENPIQCGILEMSCYLLCNLPQNAAGTSKAVVRLAVGDADAIYWHEEVSCNECRTPLTPANKV
eukprot:8513569-Prorocentrum_lima.AAC.1